MLLFFKKLYTEHKGFTLIELMIVMTILGILAAIAAPNMRIHSIRAREAVLMEDLYQMRQNIDAFYVDRARYPDSLDELISERYLRALPRDPFTRSTDTWEVLPPESSSEGELAPGGVFDVRSGSNQVGLNGIPYSDW
ncbi:MAG: general secretion pathway protein GspG [Desulfuromonas sp.]|nr:MAG: general secretion pathway protein GspG [Desulfuromonas sp.]